MSKTIAIVILACVLASAVPARAAGPSVLGAESQALAGSGGGHRYRETEHDQERADQFRDPHRDDPMAPTRLEVRPARGLRDSIAAARRRIEDISRQLNTPGVSYGKRILLERQLRLETENLNALLAQPQAAKRR